MTAQGTQIAETIIERVADIVTVWPLKSGRTLAAAKCELIDSGFSLKVIRILQGSVPLRACVLVQKACRLQWLPNADALGLGQGFSQAGTRSGER